MILLIADRATLSQVQSMMECYSTMIKIVVDIRRNMLAGGGEMHADCEQLLLENAGRYSMRNHDRKQERYLRDSLSTRLAGLASNLGRVSSSARHETSSESVAEMLEESQYYIEWTAAEAEPKVAAELVDIQRMIVLWRKAWTEAQENLTLRTLLSVQAKKWSDQVLDYSGLRDDIT